MTDLGAIESVTLCEEDRTLTKSPRGVLYIEKSLATVRLYFYRHHIFDADYVSPTDVNYLFKYKRRHQQQK